MSCGLFEYDSDGEYCSLHGNYLSPPSRRCSGLRFQYWISSARDGQGASGCGDFKTSQAWFRNTDRCSAEFDRAITHRRSSPSDRRNLSSGAFQQKKVMGKMRYGCFCGIVEIGSNQGQRQDNRQANLPHWKATRGRPAANKRACWATHRFDNFTTARIDLACSHLLGLEDHLMAGCALIRMQVSRTLFFFIGLNSKASIL